MPIKHFLRNKTAVEKTLGTTYHEKAANYFRGKRDGFNRAVQFEAGRLLKTGSVKTNAEALIKALKSVKPFFNKKP